MLHADFFILSRWIDWQFMMESTPCKTIPLQIIQQLCDRFVMVFLMREIDGCHVSSKGNLQQRTGCEFCSIRIDLTVIWGSLLTLQFQIKRNDPFNDIEKSSHVFRAKEKLWKCILVEKECVGRCTLNPLSLIHYQALEHWTFSPIVDRVLSFSSKQVCQLPIGIRGWSWDRWNSIICPSYPWPS